MKLVSVIIPTYRRGGFLPRAIESVLTQTYENVEVVVVDDNGAGSEDSRRVGEILGELRDGRVRLIVNEKNLGGARARNAGIGAARGEYITFLDDDDVYLPDKIALQVTGMEEMNLDMCLMDADIADEDGNIIDRRVHNISRLPGREELLTAHLTRHLTPTGAYMFTSESLRAIGGFDDVATAHEYLLMLKAIERDLRIGYVNESRLIQYVHSGGRISTGDNKLKGEKRLYEIKRGYFDMLTLPQRRQITMRHYAVLFFVHYSRHEYIRALDCGARAFLASPGEAAKLLRDKGRMMGA